MTPHLAWPRPALTPPDSALAAPAAALPALALAAAAGAVTLTGSGASAAQPYMLQLFKSSSKLHRNIVFKYIPDGGNAGVKDVQAGAGKVAIAEFAGMRTLHEMLVTVLGKRKLRVTLKPATGKVKLTVSYTPKGGVKRTLAQRSIELG